MCIEHQVIVILVPPLRFGCNKEYRRRCGPVLLDMLTLYAADKPACREGSCSQCGMSAHAVLCNYFPVVFICVAFACSRFVAWLLRYASGQSGGGAVLQYAVVSGIKRKVCTA